MKGPGKSIRKVCQTSLSVLDMWARGPRPPSALLTKRATRQLGPGQSFRGRRASETIVNYTQGLVSLRAQASSIRLRFFAQGFVSCLVGSVGDGCDDGGLGFWRSFCCA